MVMLAINLVSDSEECRNWAYGRRRRRRPPPKQSPKINNPYIYPTFALYQRFLYARTRKRRHPPYARPLPVEFSPRAQLRDALFSRLNFSI